MKIEMFGKEREFTLKGSLIFIGELIAFFCVAKILQYHVAHVNDDEIVKMHIIKVNFKNTDGNT